MQSSFAAIDQLMRGRQAEWIPSHDSPWGDTAKKWVGQGMPVDAQGNPADGVDHFGFDMAGLGGWFDWQPLRGVREVVEDTSEWQIIRNGSGALLKWWKDKSGTPEHIGFAMTDRAVWERDYRPHVATFDRERIGDLDGVRQALKRRREQGKWTFYGNQFIWENLRASLGDQNMFMALLTDPDWIHDFNRVYTDLYKQCFAIILEEAGKPDGIWVYEDLGYRDRLFCSPTVLAELIFPYYAELVAFFHSYDLPVVFHTCGYQEPALPLVVEAGFDAINPMEVKAGNDILAYAEQYGDRLAFVGGLDARILESGDRDAIRSGVVSLITGMRERGARFVYGSDHSLSTNIDYDDFVYSMAVYREHCVN